MTGDMTLGELIKWLEKQDQDAVVEHGFSSPHSDRGYYEHLAFTPEPESSISSMLAYAKLALGATFVGYKGGDFKMTENTPVLIGQYGECGEAITSLTLSSWLMSIELFAPHEQVARQRGHELVFTEIANERARQDVKWGQQDHHPAEWLSILGEEFGEVCKAVCEAHFQGYKSTGNWDNYREELIHTAAVAVAMVENHDRNRAALSQIESEEAEGCEDCDDGCGCTDGPCFDDDHKEART